MDIFEQVAKYQETNESEPFDEVSKVSSMRSKAVISRCAVNRVHRETCLLGGRPPALRRRELIPGCCTKRGNLAFRCEGRTSSGEPDKRESTDAEHRQEGVRFFPAFLPGLFQWEHLVGKEEKIDSLVGLTQSANGEKDEHCRTERQIVSKVSN